MTSYLTPELLKLSQNPKYFGTVTNPTHNSFKENVLCGDSINIQLKVVDDIIMEAKFTGTGCALVIASGDKLISKILNKNINKIDLNENNWLENFQPAIPAGRQKCVLLAIATLKEALA